MMFHRNNNIEVFGVEFEFEGIYVTRSSDDRPVSETTFIPYCYIRSFEEMIQYVREEEDMFDFGNHEVSDAIMVARDVVVGIVNDFSPTFADIEMFNVEFGYGGRLVFSPRGVYMSRWEDDEDGYSNETTFFTKFCWIPSNDHSKEEVEDFFEDYCSELYETENDAAIIDYITKSLKVVEW